MLRLACLALTLTAVPAGAFELGLPIGCTVGTHCFIQSYFDRDDGPGAQDYACGGQTYDGHDGTDIRVRTIAEVARGVAVLAAAPGVVVGVRDGMADRLVRTNEDRAAVGQRECGNGVRIDHGGGWHTQYCHMRQGSIAVRKGDKVAAGAKLGEVGYSGTAAFPHVEVSVSKNGESVDPFLADGKVACGASAPSLWSEAARAALAYQPGALLRRGLADHAIALAELEEGVAFAAPKPDTPMVAYLWAINLSKGDRLEVALKKEDKVVAENTATLDRNKAQYMLFAGKKAPSGGWPAGAYMGEVRVMRGGKPAITGTTEPLVFE